MPTPNPSQPIKEMLKDYSHLQKQEGDTYKKWFSDESFDLTLYYDGNDKIIRFELCYDKGHNEHAITWRAKGGFSHLRVDDGEGEPGRYKMSPILLSDGDFDWRRIAAQFREASEDLEKEISDFIYNKIMQFPGKA